MPVDDSADFGKQRRNLMIISSVLLLHEILGINYEDFKLFGMEIKNPEYVTWIIWIVWIYFFIRYFNLFSEKENIFKNKLKDAYEKKLIDKYKYIFLKEFNIKSYERSETTGSYLFPTFNLYHVKSIRRHNEDNALKKSYSTTIKDFIYFFPKSLKEYLFKQHYFFEYYFPIIFSLSPLIWSTYKLFIS